MMRRQRAQASSLFLLELILSLLFFILAAAVCVPLFVRAQLWSREAQSLQLAVHECCNVAELVNAAEDRDEALRLLALHYPEAQETEGEAAVVSIGYARDGSPAAPPQAAYLLRAELSEDGGQLLAQISMSEDDDSLYELSIRHSLLGRAGHAK